MKRSFFTFMTLLFVQLGLCQKVVPVSITNILKELHGDKEISSLSAAILHNGEVYKIHRGKLDNDHAPNDDTLYEIASLTKTFTGTLMAKAIVEGKAKIDDDVRLYLKEELPNLEYQGNPITLRHILTHTSGLPNMIPLMDSLFVNPNFDRLPFQLVDAQKQLSKSQFFDVLGQVTLDTIPGHIFGYSNAGANLIGFCLENIYQKPYKLLLKEHLLDSLQMNSTRIALSKKDHNRLAQGYNFNGIKMPFLPGKYMSAEGGIKSSLHDMILYMRFHLNTTNEVVKMAQHHLWKGKFGDYDNGFFWQIFKDGDQPDKVFQNGGAFGTSSWMTLIPETKTAVFLVTNVSGPEIHKKLNEAVNRILKTLH